MSDETTPLTSTVPPYPGPIYVFPGGVSPRSRRHKLRQMQCCIGITFMLILLVAFVVAIIFTYNNNIPISTLTLLANTSASDTATDEAAIRSKLESVNAPLPDEPESEWALKDLPINQAQGDDAVHAGIKALGDRELIEEIMQSTPVNSPAFRHYRSLSTNPEARKLARRGYVENHATQSLANTFNYTKAAQRSDIGRGPRIVLPDSTLNYTCDFNAPYRTPSGLCNNKAHPRTFGVAMVPFRRVLAPDYADGISMPRSSHNPNTSLPTARDVSLKIHRSSYETDSNFTVMLAVFGQFLDHDFTATSLNSLPEGESINCCTVPLAQHPECFPVPIKSDDPFYKMCNLTCMNFVRAAPAPTGHFGPRQQINQASAFIDGSVVYGNSKQRQEHLRSMNNGMLRMFVLEDGRELLPLSTNLDDGCNRAALASIGQYCFEAGDERANENLLLTSMHLIWARQHNYLARGLQETNPEWSDETVYQEARKILGAQIAHITYNEFLPILLGRELAQKKGLLPEMHNLDAADTYDRHVNPTMANSFASAAFRFAHTLLPSLFNMTRDNTTKESIELHKMLFNPFSLWHEKGVDHALMAASNTPVQRVDRFFSPEVTQKLFAGKKQGILPVCGLDLVSLNIQRGRDHGLPGYNVFRRHCKLPPVDTWEQMATAMDADTLKSIKEIYDSPEDVDVYTGALSEPPLKDAIFGPLLTCMVSDQFLRLKKGDSFWYERKIGPQRFTKDQLREIYKTTLSGIICRNSDSIQKIRRYVMERRKDTPNDYVHCIDIISFNFTYWSQDLHPVHLHRSRVSAAPTFVRIMNPANATSNSK